MMKITFTVALCAIAPLLSCAAGNAGSLRKPEAPAGYVPLKEEDSVCDSNWMSQIQRLNSKAKRKWNQSSCYTFTFQRSCDCPNNVPHTVIVKNGELVAPFNEDGIALAPTMEQISDLIAELCYSKCPELGPSKCDFSFNRELGYVQRFKYDLSSQLSGDELEYEVSDFQLC